MPNIRSSIKTLTLLWFIGVVTTPTLHAFSPYDFGSHIGDPRSFATNPALSVYCPNSIYFDFTTRSSDVTVNTADGRKTDQPGGGYGSLAFGGCYAPVDWISAGGYISLSTLTFDFTTQQLQNPIAFPYSRNFLPVGAFGGAVRITEGLSVGMAWKILENVGVELEQRSSPEIATVATVDVRPQYNFVAGAAYHWEEFIFHAAFSPELSGGLDLNVGLPLNINPLNIQADIDLVRATGAISYIPAELAAGVWYQNEQFTLDIGLIYEEWSALDDLFLEFELPLGLESLFFQTTDYELIDTWSPYFKASMPFTFMAQYPATVGFGYAYRPSVVEDIADDQPIRGADMHSFNGNAGIETVLQSGFRASVYAQLNYSRLVDPTEVALATVDGDVITLSFSGMLRF